jgi:Ca2+-binding RTX toxin-like protein
MSNEIQTRLVTTSDINDTKYVITPGETLTGNFADIMGGKDLDGVVQLSNDCSGVLLSSGKHILTAGHCLIDEKSDDINVIFKTETGTKVIASKQLFIHPSYNNTTTGHDLGIIELAETAPLSASRYDIYRDKDEIGKTFLKVGYGDTGKTKADPDLYDGKKRAGLNTFEAFIDQFDEKFDIYPVPLGTQLVFDYDNGLVANDAFGKLFNKPNLGLGLDEVNTAGGDSGGPAFINGKIAGITSAGIAKDAGVTTDVDNIENSSFGEFGFDNRVSVYANWIDGILNNTQSVPTAGSTLNGSPGNYTIIGSIGNDLLNGGDGEDRLNGRAGSDTLIGGAGNDLLNGGDGPDRLNGRAGADTLIGAGGNDTFLVNPGNDLLTGGVGADKFTYNTKAIFAKTAVGVDTITDFVISQNDKIVLDKTTFPKITSANGTGFSIDAEFAKVNTDTKAAISGADIIYNTATGALFYNENGTASGFGTGGKFAVLSNKPVLTENQFIIQA